MIDEHDVVVASGVRTPFVKAWTQLDRVHPVELGRLVVREAIERADLDPAAIDEVVVGNIAGPADAANIGRVISLMAKVPERVPAFTVNRNCASGIESLVEGAYRIPEGFEVSSLPENRLIDEPWGSFELTYEKKDGEVRFSRTLAFKVLRIPKAEYEKFREFAGTVDVTSKDRIVLSRIENGK